MAKSVLSFNHQAKVMYVTVPQFQPPGNGDVCDSAFFCCGHLSLAAVVSRHLPVVVPEMCSNIGFLYPLSQYEATYNTAIALDDECVV